MPRICRNSSRYSLVEIGIWVEVMVVLIEGNADAMFMLCICTAHVTCVLFTRPALFTLCAERMSCDGLYHISICLA